MRKTPRHYLLAVAASLVLFCSDPALGATQEQADASFAAGNWAEAAAAYQELLSADESNANNWYSLARAEHQLGELESARDAYLKAMDAGYQPVGRIHYHLGRAYVSLGNKDKAFEQLEALAKAGQPNARIIQSASEYASLAGEPRYEAVIDKLTPCNTPEYHQFDFWLGEWDVGPAGAPQPTSTNNISSAQSGCVVLEQYSAGGGAFTGMSINFYDSRLKKWHQTWMSNTGNTVYLEGGLNADGAMEMSDKDLPISKVTGTINKVTWTPNSDGSVRQLWQTSSDGGETWTVTFDGHYTPKEASD